MDKFGIVKHLRNKNYSYQQIGNFLGISRQRVQQIFTKYKTPYDKNKKRIFLDDFIRLEIMKRDKFKCRKCHFKGNWRDGILVVHHIDHTGQIKNANNTFENLVTLCKKCHDKYFNKLKIQPKLKPIITIKKDKVERIFTL